MIDLRLLRQDPDGARARLARRRDPAVDAIIVILTPQAMTQPAVTARGIAACNRRRKPILVSFMGGQNVMPGREELVASGLPDYESPERAVAALRAKAPGYSTAVIKEAMAMLGKPGGGRVRPPMARLTPADREHLRELLPSLGVAAIA